MTEGNERSRKRAERSRFTVLRDSLSSERRTEWSSAACGHLAEWVELRQYSAVMVYISFRSELNLKHFVEWCWVKGIDVIAPRCVNEDRSMTLHRLRNWDELQSGMYGIMEPNADLTPALSNDFLPDMVAVPGLVFDLRGGRMGYGGGYYDRFADALLQKNTASARKDIPWIGVGFEAQLVEEVPLEAHDIRLDGIVTEKAMRLLHK